MNTLGRARVQTFLALPILGGILFGSAGDLRWFGGWAYMAILLFSTVLPLYGPFQFDIGLIEERMKPKPDAKAWDRIFVVATGLLTVAELMVPGFGRRWNWSRPLPGWEIGVGLVLVAVGTVGLMWAMKTNKFFSAVIRIQKDRDHHVISSGPYSLVRHPGYAFWGLRTLGCPLLFGSLWAFIPAVIFVAMFVVRTGMEDGVLKRELPGYIEYSAKVRFKLIPGIW